MYYFYCYVYSTQKLNCIIEQLHNFNCFTCFIFHPTFYCVMEHIEMMFPFSLFGFWYHQKTKFVASKTRVNFYTVFNVCIWVKANEYNFTPAYILRQLHYVFVLTGTVIRLMLVLIDFYNNYLKAKINLQIWSLC